MAMNKMPFCDEDVDTCKNCQEWLSVARGMSSGGIQPQSMVENVFSHLIVKLLKDRDKLAS